MPCSTDRYPDASEDERDPRQTIRPRQTLDTGEIIIVEDACGVLAEIVFGLDVIDDAAEHQRSLNLELL